MSHDVINAIQKGKTSLGIELGSTRIKAVLIGDNMAPIASGSHDWENQYVNNIWKVGSQPCRSVSQGVAQADCLPKTAWPPTYLVQPELKQY